MTDIDLEASDRRASDLARLRIIANRLTIVAALAIAAVALRCDPEQRTRRVEAKAQAERNNLEVERAGARAQGAAEECKRWTP